MSENALDILNIENQDTPPKEALNQKNIEVTIVTEDKIDHCHFWIGLFQKGSLSPAELNDISKAYKVFHQAATLGLKETNSLMLSDTSQEPPRFIYLVPKPNNNDIKWESTVRELIKTVQSWTPSNIGIYLAPELFSDINSQSYLLEILTNFVKNTSVEKYYLFSGEHGINAVLNTSQRLKKAMKEEKQSIYIFH